MGAGKRRTKWKRLSTIKPISLPSFCNLFGANFNIMSALFGYQLPALPQKIDSREGLLWCQKGLVIYAGKLNIHSIKSPSVPVFGLFAATCTAICCKTQCNMPLNAVRFGAKCSAFWCKMQGKMVLNAVQNAAKRKTKRINMHCNGINKTLSSH